MQNSVSIIYLLEDEQELILGMLDTSPMYLYFLLFHDIIVSILDVLYAIIYHFL